MICIRQDDPLSPAVAGLMAVHLAEARASTPAANAHALDARGLADPAITFWTAWDGGTLAGFVALKQLDAGHGEIKSMRTAASHLRRGVARMLLDHALGEARTRGFARISLETGTAATFLPANALYESHGFVDGPVFGGYPPSPHNRFLTLLL